MLPSKKERRLELKEVILEYWNCMKDSIIDEQEFFYDSARVINIMESQIATVKAKNETAVNELIQQL